MQLRKPLDDVWALHVFAALEASVQATTCQLRHRQTMRVYAPKMMRFVAHMAAHREMKFQTEERLVFHAATRLNFRMQRECPPVGQVVVAVHVDCMISAHFVRLVYEEISMAWS